MKTERQRQEASAINQAVFLAFIPISRFAARSGVHDALQQLSTSHFEGNDNPIRSVILELIMKLIQLEGLAGSIDSHYIIQYVSNEDLRR